MDIYKSLNAQRIIDTVRMLGQRISERFPGAGLVTVCEQLIELAETAKRDSIDTTKPVIPLRIGIGFLIALIFSVLVLSVPRFAVFGESVSFPDFVQMVEAGINDLVLIGIGIFFLASLERRVKRRRVLRAIHELRSIAHIVDMHQLTKDPGHTIHRYADTASSPRRTMGTHALVRYLDYCAEMLSLIGKIAALYVERFDDSVVLASVNEIESLTGSLGGKIWQKLMILELSGQVAIDDLSPEPAVKDGTD